MRDRNREKKVEHSFRVVLGTCCFETATPTKYADPTHTSRSHQSSCSHSQIRSPSSTTVASAATDITLARRSARRRDIRETTLAGSFVLTSSSSSSGSAAAGAATGSGPGGGGGGIGGSEDSAAAAAMSKKKGLLLIAAAISRASRRSRILAATDGVKESDGDDGAFIPAGVACSPSPVDAQSTRVGVRLKTLSSLVVC